MTYVVARPAGRWEIRESRATPAGPRARTLATFRTLSPEVIEHARSRSTSTLDADALRRAARRAGAEVSLSTTNRSAAELLVELDAGRAPRPALRRLLLGALQTEPLGTTPANASDNARAAARWLTATPELRGETLRDLLLLSDRLPPSRTSATARFPRIESPPS
jgi:hypothetical protein